MDLIIFHVLGNNIWYFHLVKLISIIYERSEVKLSYDFFQPDYRLCVKHYLANGKDGYDVFKDCEVLVRHLITFL